MKKFLNVSLVFILLLSIGVGMVMARSYISNRHKEVNIKDGHNEVLSWEMFDAVNRERELHGLHTLGWDKDLYAASQIRAKELVEFMDHNRPDGKPFYTVSPKAKGENIARGYDTVVEVMVGFMDSAGHRNAIISKSYYTGACSVYFYDGLYYYVQLFGK